MVLDVPQRTQTDPDGPPADRGGGQSTQGEARPGSRPGSRPHGGPTRTPTSRPPRGTDGLGPVGIDLLLLPTDRTLRFHKGLMRHPCLVFCFSTQAASKEEWEYNIFRHFRWCCLGSQRQAQASLAPQVLLVAVRRHAAAAVVKSAGSAGSTSLQIKHGEDNCRLLLPAGYRQIHMPAECRGRYTHRAGGGPAARGWVTLET